MRNCLSAVWHKGCESSTLRMFDSVLLGIPKLSLVSLLEAFCNLFLALSALKFVFCEGHKYFTALKKNWPRYAQRQ